MTIQVINIGTAPNDGTGDSLRIAFNKINQNFAELSSSNLTSSNIRISGNTISVVNNNGNIVLAPSGSGKVVLPNYSFPTVGGTSGQVLKWPSVGSTLEWSTVSSGSSSSSDRLVNSSYSVILSSAGLTQFPAINNESLFIQASELGSANASIGISAKDSVIVTANILGTAKQWSFNTNGSVTLPGSSSINASSSVSLTAGTQADLENLQDTWVGNEFTWIFQRDIDASAIAPATRPWAGMSSYNAYPLIMSYTNPVGVLPVPSNLPPVANSAKQSHEAWLSALATVNGVKLTSGAKDWQFKPTGVLELPGAVQLKVYANTQERDVYIETPVAGMMILVGTSTQIYNGSAWRTLSYV